MNKSYSQFFKTVEVDLQIFVFTNDQFYIALLKITSV